MAVTSPPVRAAADREAAARARADRRRGSRGPGRGLRALVLLAAALALGTLGGLVALWPHGHVGPRGRSAALGGATLAAKVERAIEVRCPGPTPQRCRRLLVRIGEGHDRGTTTSTTLGPVASTPSFAVGDAVRVQPVDLPRGAHGERYALAGADRRGALRWLVVLFAVLVVALARSRGVAALAGFALSLLLILKFIVPAILAGSPPMLVALVGALAVMFVTVVLTYGVGPPALAATLGIAGSLAVAAGLGTVAVDATRLDGRSGDLSIALSQTAGSISLQGVVLAGLVLGALGVLADMGVTQASAVLALRRARPELGPTALFRAAFAVGRDHLVATTHTLVLAYAGATLPLLLVLRATGVAPVDALNAQDVAEPIVATLVGAVALLISVPLTTAIAAALVARTPTSSLPADDGHAHAH